MRTIGSSRSLMVRFCAAAPTPPRLILLFSDEAAWPFRKSSWVSDVIAAHQVKIRVVELPAELREAVLAAQRRQYR